MYMYVYVKQCTPNNAVSKVLIMKILITKPTGLGVTVMGGHIYAAGGHSGAAYLDRVERYEPFTDTWSLVKTMLNCRCNFAFAAL